MDILKAVVSGLVSDRDEHIYITYCPAPIGKATST